jgi:TetR/AcrR family transcriptional repressor of multidrug resistance operon
VRVKDDNKQRAICDAAIKLITENGFADTSMSKIAREAGVSPATIYVYFENKEDLLNKLYSLVKQEMAAVLIKGLKPGTPVKDSFRTVWENFYLYATGNRLRFAFTEQFANSPLVDGICKEESMEHFKPLLDLVERGKKEKVLKNISPEMFQAFTFVPLTGLIKQHISGEIVLDKRKLAAAREIAWDAVAK